MSPDNTKEAKLGAALRAIDVMGGPVIAAKKITALTGKACTRDRIQKWKQNGIAPPWHPIVHQLTQIPLTELDPDIYPSYLFSHDSQA